MFDIPLSCYLRFQTLFWRIILLSKKLNKIDKQNQLKVGVSYKMTNLRHVSILIHYRVV